MIETDIKLSRGGFIAEISSKHGGTCFRLYHKKYKTDILRWPKDEEHLKENVFLFGNPLLFPPNRIKGGSICFEGRIYPFPINEEKTGCHLHGILYSMAFNIESIRKNKVSLVFSAKEKEYLGIPQTVEKPL